MANHRLLFVLILFVGIPLIAAQGEEELGAEVETSECSQEELGDYNLGLHIGAVFILLAVSCLGSFLPVFLNRFTRKAWVIICIKLGTFFGIGTILATAFIHMLTPAAEKLTSPCLPESWTEGYEAWTYLFALIAVLFMQALDYLIEVAYNVWTATDTIEHIGHGHTKAAMSSIHKSQHSLAHDRIENAAATVDEEAPTAVNDGEKVCEVHGHGCRPLLAAGPRDPSAVVGIYLLELGIVIHSVLIGIALGVSSGSEFVTLLIALSFHQAFEGFAIGAAAVDAGLGQAKSMLLAGIYSLTTPVGIAIGIGVRSSYNPNSQTALYTEGILDSLCAGILIYVGIVELLSPLMTQSKWLKEQRWYLQMVSFGALYAGVAVMAVIGKWA